MNITKHNIESFVYLKGPTPTFINDLMNNFGHTNVKETHRERINNTVDNLVKKGILIRRTVVMEQTYFDEQTGLSKTRKVDRIGFLHATIVKRMQRKGAINNG